ncbi:MAG: hypothetical protein B6U87_00775 [Candidatus Aenigmarchaeota archaeon ex4484_52]|nr:MAG: hypothetical protein B6U87_00775 [Candidatus Aenigmarchaeota archaeon ex4484_52]
MSVTPINILVIIAAGLITLALASYFELSVQDVLNSFVENIINPLLELLFGSQRNNGIAFTSVQALACSIDFMAGAGGGDMSKINNCAGPFPNIAVEIDQGGFDKATFVYSEEDEEGHTVIVDCTYGSHCQVENFYLPQEIGIVADWVFSVGDPEFITYFEGFPTGEDACWTAQPTGSLLAAISIEVASAVIPFGLGKFANKIKESLEVSKEVGGLLFKTATKLQKTRDSIKIGIYSITLEKLANSKIFNILKEWDADFKHLRKAKKILFKNDNKFLNDEFYELGGDGFLKMKNVPGSTTKVLDDDTELKAILSKMKKSDVDFDNYIDNIIRAPALDLRKKFFKSLIFPSIKDMIIPGIKKLGSMSTLGTIRALKEFRKRSPKAVCNMLESGAIANALILAGSVTDEGSIEDELSGKDKDALEKIQSALIPAGIVTSSLGCNVNQNSIHIKAYNKRPAFYAALAISMTYHMQLEEEIKKKNEKKNTKINHLFFLKSGVWARAFTPIVLADETLKYLVEIDRTFISPETSWWPGVKDWFFQWNQDPSRLYFASPCHADLNVSKTTKSCKSIGKTNSYYGKEFCCKDPDWDQMCPPPLFCIDATLNEIYGEKGTTASGGTWNFDCDNTSDQVCDGQDQCGLFPGKYTFPFETIEIYQHDFDVVTGEPFECYPDFTINISKPFESNLTTGDPAAKVCYISDDEDWKNHMDKAPLPGETVTTTAKIITVSALDIRGDKFNPYGESTNFCFSKGHGNRFQATLIALEIGSSFIPFVGNAISGGLGIIGGTLMYYKENNKYWPNGGWSSRI